MLKIETRLDIFNVDFSRVYKVIFDQPKLHLDQIDRVNISVCFLYLMRVMWRLPNRASDICIFRYSRFLAS